MGVFMDMSLNIDSLEITPEILSLIAALDEFKGAWKAPAKALGIAGHSFDAHPIRLGEHNRYPQ